MIYALAILLPFLALALRGKIFQSILCLILQFTVLGWILAALWAVLVVHNDNAERRHKEMLATLTARNDAGGGTSRET
jgi:uncharacterized membrane protein YqaE (UPF0057 family)